MARGAALLGACGLFAAALLAGTHAVTAQRIEAARRQAAREALAVVLPSTLHDNDAAADVVRVRAPRWLGIGEPVHAWRARLGGQPAALVLECVAPDGYAGAIALLVGIDARGKVLGVRITAHRETPGLGDGFARGHWLAGFAGRSLRDPPPSLWTVRRDGGAFDQFAGATVTPRAITAAIRRALQFAQVHGAAIHAAPTGAVLEYDDAPAS